MRPEGSSNPNGSVIVSVGAPLPRGSSMPVAGVAGLCPRSPRGDSGRTDGYAPYFVVLRPNAPRLRLAEGNTGGEQQRGAPLQPRPPRGAAAPHASTPPPP